MQIQSVNSNTNFKGLHRLECYSVIRGNKEHCYTIRHYYPFADESPDRISGAFKHYTYKMTYYPDQTGDLFWVDHNKLKLEQRLPISRSQWRKYLKERGVKRSKLVQDVEKILKKFNLEHYIPVKTANS